MKDPLIGQQLANFRVERLIGQGGMASVYYGLDIKLQRHVAIKVIDKRYKSDPAHISRFVNEARMMAKWRHENLIQIYYADDTQEHSYYVMEYIEGNDLSTVMSIYAEDQELMPIADVLRIGYSVASALDYAHGQGVIHRDIKPSNVLIANDGRVLVGDFGLALEVRGGSMGSIFGTPHYISPEQARRSADAVPQSDLYSLGVILYEIMTGSVPFNDPSPASIALQHISQSPPSPRSINPLITSAVEIVLLKALEKNPKDRYQTGGGLITALEDALKSTGSSPKISLPPLPLGVPTIKRSGIPMDQITKIKSSKIKGDTIQRSFAGLPATVRAANQPRQNPNRGYVFFVILLILFMGGWFIKKNGFFSTIVLPLSTVTSRPIFITATGTLTGESTEPTQMSTAVGANPTFILVPIYSPEALVSASPIPTVAFTEPAASATPILPVPSIEPPPSATPELLPNSTPNEIPTIKYPNGNHLTLFWNETSFQMLNRSYQPRSLAAFKFERLDQNNLPTDYFSGYRWENVKFTYIPSKYCVSIKIYQDNDPPYIDPVDCHRGYISIIQPRMDEERGLFFWILKENSTQFRVLWVGEEVARCEISSGLCEVYVP